MNTEITKVIASNNTTNLTTNNTTINAETKAAATNNAANKAENKEPVPSATTSTTMSTNTTTEKKAPANVTAARKLAYVRAKVCTNGIAKSGKAYGGKTYKYFELTDFLPFALLLMDKVGLISDFKIEDKEATLRIINTDNVEDFLTYKIPVATVNMGTPIQSLGAIVSYLRRYLWITALEICEADIVDGYDQEKLMKMNEKKGEECTNSMKS